MKISRWLYITNYCLLAVALVGCGFIANGERLFGTSPSTALTFIESLFSFLIVAVLVAAIIFLNSKFSKYKPNLVLVGILSLVLLCGIISVLTFKDYGVYNYAGIDGSNCTFEFYISSSMRGSYIFQLAGALLTIFIVFDIVHQVVNKNDAIKIVSILSIGGVLIFALISYITEFSKYVDLLPSLFTSGKYIDAPRSVFVSKNNYALILSTGLIGSIFLHHFYKKWYYFLLTGFIFINIFFTTCKLLLLLDLLFVCFYIAYYLVSNSKDKKKSTIIAIGVGSSLVLVFGTLFIVLVITNKLSFLDQNGFNTFETRSWIWRRSFEAINMGNWFTGVGYNLFGEILFRLNTYDVVTQFANNTRYAHNAFIEWIGNGGIIYLLLGLFLLVITSYMAVKNIKNNDNMSLICFALAILFTVYMLLESGSFIMPKSLDTIILAVFIITPIISTYKKAEVTVAN